MPDTLQDLLGSLQSNPLLTSPRPAIREDLPQVSPQNSVTDILEDLHANPLLSERPTQIPEQRHIDRRLESEREQWRSFYQNQGEHPVEYIGRRALPFASAIGGFLDSREYGAALRRIQSGSPQDGDYDTVGRYEARQQNDANRGTLGQIGSGLTHIPALVGEAAIGGMALRGAGLGGQAAAQVAERGPSLLSSAGLRALGFEVGANALQAARSPAAWGRNAATTATIPSMYLEGWAQRATEAGRDPWSPESAFRDLPPAFALGFMQTAVLGSLGKVGNEIPGTGLGPTLQRLAARTGTGVGEQQVIDVLAGAAHLQTGYGAIGDLIQGKFGDALKHATVQAVTFAAFSALHPVLHGEHQSPTEAYQRLLRSRSAQGLTAGSSARVANAAADRLAEALEHNPWLTRAQARELFKNERSQFVRRWGESLADALPEHLAPFQSRRGEPTANPLRPQGAPETAPLPQTTPTVAPQGVANGNGLPSTASNPRAGISSPGAPSLAEATMPVQAAPDPRTGRNQEVPGQVQRNPIPKADLFGLAEFFGIKTKIGKKERTLQEVAAEIRSQLGGESLLRAMDEQFNPAPKPQTGPTAEERAKFGVDAANPEPTLAEQGVAPPARPDPSPPAPLPRRGEGRRAPSPPAPLHPTPVPDPGPAVPTKTLPELEARVRRHAGDPPGLRYQVDKLILEHGVEAGIAKVREKYSSETASAEYARAYAERKLFQMKIVEEVAMREEIRSLPEVAKEAGLTENEAKVVIDRFVGGKTLEQIGKEIGFSKVAAKQNEQRGLEKLKIEESAADFLGTKGKQELSPEFQTNEGRSLTYEERLANAYNAAATRIERNKPKPKDNEFVKAYEAQHPEAVLERQSTKMLKEIDKARTPEEKDAIIGEWEHIWGKELKRVDKRIEVSPETTRRDLEGSAPLAGSKDQGESGNRGRPSAEDAGRGNATESERPNEGGQLAGRNEGVGPRDGPIELTGYHGTNKKYEKPKVIHEPDQDYGSGLYLALAKKDAKEFLSQGDPGNRVNEYRVRLEKPFYADRPLTPEQAHSLLLRMAGEIPIPDELSYRKNPQRGVDDAGFAHPESHSEHQSSIITGNDVIHRAEKLLGPEEAMKALQRLGFDGILGGYGLGENPLFNFSEPHKNASNVFQQVVVFDPDVSIKKNVAKRPAGNQGQGVNTEAQRLSPQAREEFLRDVIAIMRGRESPGFHPNQAEVQGEASRRLSAAETAKEKRTAINQAEKDWQEAKSEAAIQNEGRINPAEPTPPAEHRTSGGTFGEGPLIRTGGEKTAALAHEKMKEISLFLVEAEKQASRGDEAVWEAARKMAADDPGAAMRLAEEIVGSGGRRGVNAEEAMLVLHRIIAVRNEIDILRKQNEGGKALEMSDMDVARWNRRIEGLTAERDLVDHASSLMGSEAGRVLRIRRLLAKFDYSLEGMMQSARAAKGKELSEADQQLIRDLYERIAKAERDHESQRADLQKQLEEAKSKAGTGLGSAGNEARIKELEAKIDEINRGATDPGYAQWKARQEFSRWLADQRTAQATWPVKAFNMAREGLNSIPRSLMTMIDFAIMRQGQLTLLAHPFRTAGAIPEMFRSFASQEVADRAQHQMESSPTYARNMKAGLDTTKGAGALKDREEGFISNLLNYQPKDPTLNAIMNVATFLPKASERSYRTLLNRVRTQSMDALAETLARDKNGMVSDADLRILANGVNVFTGRGPLGALKPMGNLLAEVFFAPRWTLSRFQTVLGQPLWHNFGDSAPQARKLIAKEYARMAAGMGTMIGLALLAGFDIEKDPRSSDFGKMKMDNTRLDYTGGLNTVARLASRTLWGSTKNAFGQTVPLRGPNVPYRGATVWSNATDFVRQRLAPAPSAVTNLVTGENPIHQPITPAGVAGELVTPLFVKDVYDAMIDLGIPRGSALSLLALMGMSITTYQRGNQRRQAPR